MCSLLLAHGADHLARNSLGQTPLAAAAAVGHANIVDALVEDFREKKKDGGEKQRDQSPVFQKNIKRGTIIEIS